jgi:hypothetical protein
MAPVPEASSRLSAPTRSRGSRSRARAAVVPLLVALAGGLFAAARLAAQTTYHVAITGRDTDPGTETAPLRSVQKAIEMARAGDTILVHAGSYGGMLVISTSGRPDRPITLRSAGDGTVTLQASFSNRSCAATDPARDRTLEILNGSDYWTVQGFTIVGGIYIAGTDLATLGDNVTNRSLPGRGLYDPDAARNTIPSLGADPADGIQILDNRVSKRSIYVAAARDGTLEGNEIFDIDCGIGAGIWLNRFSDNWIIRRNHIHDIDASVQHYMSEGIRLGGASMYNTIEDNVVERTLGSARGFATDVNSGWNVIRRNRATQTDQGFSEQFGAWGNQWLENVAENNRRFGFNIYGQGNGMFDAGTPSLLEMRCNVSVNNPKGLSIGAVTKSTFADNDMVSVEIPDNVRSQWGSRGNTWDGSPEAPPARPPQPDSADCSPGPAPARIWGDVNRDGKVDAADGTIVLNNVAGLSTPKADITLADVDDDGSVTSRDVLIILHYAAGTEPSPSRTGTPAE